MSQPQRFPKLLKGIVLAAAGLLAATDHAQETPPFGLVVHGGAGTMTRASLAPEQEAELRATLAKATDAGFAVLAAGGTSLDAVVAALLLLEDSPLFNAGVGAVFTADARHELDASIMDGASRNAGAVAGVTKIRNPIRLARAVMDRSEHVLLSGAGAEAFAATLGLATVDNSYFDTPFRRGQLKDAQRKAAGDARADTAAPAPVHKFGTVGAVALDRHGNLAAGTSTGGMTNKRYGRIGDSPIIGAGTFADNQSCAVSATGHGEYFIRHVVAYDICAQMRYAGLSLAESADRVVNEKLLKAGGGGGVIAMDARGNIAMPFNTEGMYRAWRLRDAATQVRIYRDE